MPMSLSQDAATALSAELRTRTSAAHREAEHSPYLSALVEGRVTPTGLAALLTRLAPVYQALESAALRWADDPVAGPFVLTELHRGARIRSDVEHLTGSADVAVTPASVAYAARIELVARDSAVGFIAHHYTRYLGDLSGGQVMRAALERHLGIADGSGASFFAFPGVRPAAVKQRYRRRLDEAPLTADERERLVEEALVAYRLNVAITAELDTELPCWTAA